MEIKKSRDFTVIKESAVHGTGLFAKIDIPKGTRIIEYAGERILKKNITSDLINNLTSSRYIMNLNETTAIDGERNGNDARFINHSCAPNCTVYFFDEVPYIYALKEIIAEEELTFDYKMGSSSKEKPLDEEIKKLMSCSCGSPQCRGTLLNN